MKKIIIAFCVVIAIVVILPLVGNSATQKVLETRVSLLTSNGVEIKNSSTDATYFQTKKHYEFLVSDAPKFIEYLNQYAGVQLPPYIDTMLDGGVVGIDIEYFNIPFVSDILVDIYPLSLSTQMVKDIQKDDTSFYNYIKSLLEKKSILYHVNYSLRDSSFSGFIKDIDESYTFDNKTKIVFELNKATYSGNGLLVAPESLKSKISKINFEVSASDENIKFNLKNIAFDSNFKTSTTYSSDTIVEKFSVLMSEAGGVKAKLDVDDAKFDISSNTQEEKAKFHTKSSFKKFDLKSQELNLILSNFNYDIILDGVDKASYEEFRKLIALQQKNYSSSLDEELQDALVKIVSKGLTLNIADLSVKKLSLDKKPSIDGFSIATKLVVKEILGLSLRSEDSFGKLIEKLSIDSTVKLSKEFYSQLNNRFPVTGMANSFAKKDGDDIVFMLKFKDENLKVNDKSIQ
ncbi:MAG: hypothetical protein JJW00_08135 [Sulfurimonas sp.]|nr:hypothetical protein [Sulfurimonas sp.]